MSSILQCIEQMRPAKPKPPIRSFLERDYPGRNARPALPTGEVREGRRGRLRDTGEEARRLRRRHSAALLVRRRGFNDGELLLSYVIWPTPAIERALDSVLDGVGVDGVDDGGA